jgi:hypothetical protein
MKRGIYKLVAINHTRMTKEETAQLAEDIGNIAEDIILQLNMLKIKPTYIEEFFLGILVRERTILRDASFILRNNPELQITSAFILLRVLLEDFIRLFSVYARTNNMEDEIIKIQADAHSHRFKNIKESIEINNTYYNGQHHSLPNQQMFDAEKQKFLNNPEFDKFFEDKTNFRFKKLPPISNVYRLMQSDVKTAANVHSYIVYKFLTQHIHYSNLTFYLDNDTAIRKLEIDQIEEILLYSIKMLAMQFDFFRQTYILNWNDTKVSNYFNAKTIIV